MCYFCDSKDNLVKIGGVVGGFPDYCPVCGKYIFCDTNDSDKIYFVPINDANDYGCVDTMIFENMSDIVADDSDLHNIIYCDGCEIKDEYGPNIFTVYEARPVGSVEIERVTQITLR